MTTASSIDTQAARDAWVGKTGKRSNAVKLPLEPPKLARQNRYLTAIRTGDVATMRQIRAEMEHEKEVMGRKER